MSALRSLDQLLAARDVWRGRPAASQAPSGRTTGIASLDAVLPNSGWPPASLIELLLPADGVGELTLLWPILNQLTTAGESIALVAPPYIPYAPAWYLAGILLDRLMIVRAEARDALWAAEQCLRSGACAAVLCWPHHANDRALRRLQVAAETGHCLGFAFRSIAVAENPSPAALRIAFDATSRQIRVIKCRGTMPPSRAIVLPPFLVH